MIIIDKLRSLTLLVTIISILNLFIAGVNGDNDISSDEDKDEQPPEEPKLNPCSVIHPLTNGFYDLSDLSSIYKESLVGWVAKGHDYNTNFTLGICSSPLKPNVEIKNNNFKSAIEINSSDVGGFYTNPNGDRFSIGNFNTTPIFRGKKLTLQYNNGSFCPNGIDRKSTILSFSCDREILSKAAVSFVGVLHDCDYFFEVRTVHACPTAQKADNLALIWIFLFIFLAAFLVYSSGGFLYKRIVLNRRGWSQIPSYGIGNKVTNAFQQNWSRSNSRGSDVISMSSDRYGFMDDQNNNSTNNYQNDEIAQNNLIDSLDA